MLATIFGQDVGWSQDDLAGLRQSDAKLNNLYQEILQNLNTAGRSYLKSMESAWVGYKDRDMALLSRVAAQAGDRDRIFRYQREQIEGQIAALSSLGARQSKAGESVQDRARQPIRTARDADQILNSVYRECLALMPSEHVQEFKEIEAAWIEYRDLYCRFDSAIKNGQYDDFVLRDMTMARVIQLRNYHMVLLARELPVAKTDNESAPSKANSEDPSLPDIFRFAR